MLLINDGVHPSPGCKLCLAVNDSLRDPLGGSGWGGRVEVRGEGFMDGGRGAVPPGPSKASTSFGVRLGRKAGWSENVRRLSFKKQPPICIEDSTVKR